MKPYVQAYWAKTKDFFSRPKVIRRTVIILTSAILLIFVLALVWAIYTKDEPVFVPEEVRGNIQEAIADGGEAIKTLSEPLGSAIVEAGYIHTLESATDSENGDDGATANWPTYTNEELGISFKYPEGWVVEVSGAGLKVYDEGYSGFESEFPMVLLSVHDGSGLGLENWLDQNKVIFVGDQSETDENTFTNKKTGITGNFESLAFNYESMGTNLVTLLKNGDKIIVLEKITLGQDLESLGNSYEALLKTIK